MEQGAVDVTQTATPYLIQAVLRGSDAVGIASETANPIYSLIVKPEIASFADLKGRLLGLSLPIDTISISMRKLLALKGLGAADYRVKELVGTPVRFECLRRGECDGVPLGQPDDLIAMTQGYRRLGLSTEAVSAFQFQLLAVKRSWAASQQGCVVRFVRAIASSLRFMRDPANRDEVVKTMVAVTGSTEDIARQTLALYFEPDRGVMPKQGEISIAGLGAGHRVHGRGRHAPAAVAGAGALRRPAISEGGGRRVGATSRPPCSLQPWRRPTARPSRPASQSCGRLPAAASACSIEAKRRSNFWLAARSVASGSASRWRARLTTANSRSPTSAAALSRSPAAISASISSHSSRIFVSTASGSFQSKPTLPALACSFSARVRAGSATGTPASAPVSGGLAALAARSAFSSALMRSHRPSTCSR